MSDNDPPGIDPELLERLRRGVPLRLTAMGEFRLDDEPVTHPGVLAALRAGLDVTESGEPIVRLGQQWCYLTVDDTPMRATAIDVEGDHLWARLDDGRRVALPLASLWEEPDLGLRGTVPSAPTARPLSVRFTNRAQMDLAPHLEHEADRTRLRLGDRSHEIPTQAPND